MKLPSIFSDNMVLQRQRPIPVWGWANPGEKITVTLLDRSRRTAAGRDGKWRVRLPALPAGGPFEMTIRGSQTITFHNVMIGEVWVCSGQSNMEWPLEQSDNAEDEIARAERSGLRLFTVGRAAVVEPAADVVGVWEVCSPQTVRTFSAVAYHFGRELIGKLKVPIGLINTSWGGTIAEAWTSREALVADRQFKPLVTAYEKGLKTRDRDLAAYQAKVKEGNEAHYPQDPGNVGFAAGWAAEGQPADGWGSMPMPGAWQRNGLDFSGVVWFRRTVEIPAEWAGRDLTLNLAACDKHDTTYFNNTVIGGIGRENPNAWAMPREYRVPGHLVKAGPNVIAVRIYSYAYAGGMLGSSAQMSLGPSDLTRREALPLAGPWQYRVEHNFGIVQPMEVLMPLGPGNPSSPYSLYRGMLSPLIPYAIRGAIWYQGESNAPRACEYRRLFPLMIRSWRKAWRQGPLAFLFVQLANYYEKQKDPMDSQWAELREAQTMTLRLPNTGMAVAIDIGEATDIHPRNKREVGRRLALQAFDGIYGIKNITASGPLYRSARRQGGKMRVSFDHVGKGLTAKGGKLEGFAIAGPDRKFRWADARIEGGVVVVWHDDVSRPTAVRYGWADNPIGNLYNKNGLPASPFRTDRWPGLTAPAKDGSGRRRPRPKSKA